MQPAWLGYQERGSVLGYRLIAWVARKLGRRLTRLLLYPICLYYIVQSRETSRASRQYLQHLHGRAPGWIEVFRHHYHFAATLLDRVFIFSAPHVFDVRYYGADAFGKLADAGRGCLMLSAHMGSYEFMRAFGLRNRFVVNMLMYEDNAQKLGTVTDSLDHEHERRIIPIGPVDSLLIAKERLDRGELVGILGDRTVSGERLVRARFFGKDAYFPAGPFLAAAVLKVPVVLFVCTYRGGNRYELHFETFGDQLALDRRNPADLEKWVQRYADRLEHYCRLEPYNWFNFYDFWAHPQEEVPAAPPARAA